MMSCNTNIVTREHESLADFLRKKMDVGEIISDEDYINFCAVSDCMSIDKTD